jgi:hypothetical protein
MNDLFSMKHYFVVFHPGSGGNFLSGLLTKLLTNELSILPVTATGSSHTTVDNKNNGLDLSCGTFIDSEPMFQSHDDKVLYYRNKFTTLDITSPQISWTHDFTNIPVYRQLFPNSKILVVTQESKIEKFTITILQQLKNILDPNVNSAVPEQKRNEYLLRWKERSNLSLSKLLDDDVLASKIIEDRFNPIYKDVITYVTLSRMLGYYRLLNGEQDVVNYVLKPTIGDKVPYEIVAPYSDYIDEECVLLPYDVIRLNDSDQLIQKFTELFGEIDAKKQEYIKYTLNKYHTGQNQQVLNDPIEYLTMIKSNTLSFAKGKHT